MNATPAMEHDRYRSWNFCVGLREPLNSVIRSTFGKMDLVVGRKGMEGDQQKCG